MGNNPERNNPADNFHSMTRPGGTTGDGGFGFYGVIQNIGPRDSSGCAQVTIAVLGTTSVIRLMLPNSLIRVPEDASPYYHVGAMINFMMYLDRALPCSPPAEEGVVPSDTGDAPPN